MTTGATNVTSTSAMLNAVGSCDTTCTAFMRWRAVGSSTWTNGPPITVGNPVSNAPWSQTASGLFPGAQYEYQTCGKEAAYSQFFCVGPDGAGNTTSQFTTPSGLKNLSISAQPALSPGWDPSISDYVVRCGSGPVTMTVSGRAGTKVSIDGQPARGGNFTQAVPLSAGQEFSFATIVSGQTETFYVRCLPTDFPSWSFSRTAHPTEQWTLVDPSTSVSAANNHYLAFFDTDGVPVWWYSADVLPVNATLLSDNTIAFMAAGGSFATNPSSAYEIRRLDGSLARTLQTVGSPTDFHELQQLPNGDFLLPTYVPRDNVDLSAYGGPSNATVVDGEIQEIAPNGSVVWSWNSKDHIALSESGRWWPLIVGFPTTLPDGRVAYDPVHLNAIEPDGNSLLVSLRQTDAIYQISRSDGSIEWKLGGTTTPQSLTVSGDNQSQTLGGQHDVRLLADGTVSVHDNGTNLSRAPRVLRFRVDPTQKTATLVQMISDPEVTSSFCCGSARQLASSNWLIDWGGTSTVAEYQSDGSRVFKLQFSNNLFSYRAFPVPSGRISADSLRQGMNTMFPR